MEFIAPLASVAVLVLYFVGFWKTFSKAGEAGWASIVPFYNMFVLLRIAGRPGWWFLLLLVPLVGLIVFIIVSIDLARKFGQSGAFGVFALGLFGFIGFPIIGFGDAQYDAEA